MRQLANRTGKFIIQNPFWILVIGSLGIHTAFALITPSPIKKVDKEVEVLKNSPIPLIKLPPNLNQVVPKPNKSVLENLFVKPSNPKANPKQTLPSVELDQLENLPPVASDFSFSVPPLLTAPLNPVEPPRFVQNPNFINSPLLSRLNPLGQIDNSLKNPKTTNSNLRDNFQNNLRNNPTTPPSNNNPPKNPQPTPTETPRSPVTVQPNSSTSPSKTSTPSTKPSNSNPEPTPTTSAPSPVSENNSKEPSKQVNNSASILAFVATDRRIKNLIDKNLLITTQIAPPEALIPNPEQTREKGVVWIPPKVKDVGGRRGVILYYWIVAPSGEVQLAGYTSGDRELVDADQELVNVVLETVKDYRFQPIADPQTGIYRLVTARYAFPYAY
ncbi:MAG: hypothetical protein NW214_02405 [Pseudanabaenaceae cyanobacterium bins.39]|nr:hypothetical protein [Pseudanabaenaceae cyanobacterium bins.39]